MTEFEEKSAKESLESTSGAAKNGVQETERESESEKEEDERIEEGAPAEVRVLMVQLEEVKTTMEMIENLGKEQSKGLAMAQLENLRLVWGEFRTAFRTVVASDNARHVAKIKFNQLQKRFIELCGKANDFATESTKKMNVYLPKIKLTEFESSPTAWREFNDLFDKIVHTDDTIAEAIKIQYLKICLKGETARIEAHISPNASNYNTCYEILQRRFENKREVFGKLMNSFLNLQKLTKGSSAGLKTIHDVTTDGNKKFCWHNQHNT